jgi:hypothetical protein
MEIKTKYLNKLKELYKMNVLFFESSFIDFIDKLKKIYPKAKNEIKNAHTLLNASQYKRFAEKEIIEINNLNFRAEDNQSNIVEHWFIKYNIIFSGIDSILYLDDETSLYSDLSYYISFAPDMELADGLYNLQKDFLIFTKAWIADDLINYINSFKDFKDIDNSNDSVDHSEPNDIVKLVNAEKINDNIELIDNQNVNIENKNFHPRIFACLNAFKLFNCFKEEVREKCKLADYSFIYRQMQEDNLIYPYVGVAEYRNFLYEEFDIDIDKIKQLSGCSTANKKSIYSKLKEQNKPY